ncbi:hypothetical protein SESBI_49026, partial [Sesbania bispinosa]
MTAASGEGKGRWVNGYIVYTRRKRNLHSENEKAKRLKTCDNAGVKVESRVLVEEAAVWNGAVFGNFKRHRRSALKKPKVESEDAAADKSDLELKIPNEIIMVNKKPMTVKELFDTGCSMGFQLFTWVARRRSTWLNDCAYLLRNCLDPLGDALIKMGGYCARAVCAMDRRVIPPSQFEIHACNTYKRAAQYICLENGKSLLELLGACRAAPLSSLEATIQNFVCSPPEEKYFTCKSCKGCFPSSTVERVGLICHSCMESRKSEDSSIHAVGKRIRSPRPILFSSPSCTLNCGISSQTKRRWKTRTKSSKRVSCSNSTRSASVPIVFRKKSLCSMEK